jgi:hypothetical protein
LNTTRYFTLGVPADNIVALAVMRLQHNYPTVRFAFLACLSAAGLLAPPQLRAQDAKSEPKPEPDVLLFNNGEKLIGHLVRATGDTVTFKSDMAGEITVQWKKIQELRSSQNFAVVRKDVKLHKGETDGKVPRGTIAVKDQKIEVSRGTEHPPETVPVSDASYVIDEATFQKALHRPGILEDWKGAVTAGVSLVEATQSSSTFTGAFGLVRAVPAENWLDPRNRTLVDFSASYGKVTQPDKPTLKTAIYHAGAERDEYFRPRFYGFGQLAYDHNFSQGLDLQQSYGGGIGWTVIKSANQALDLKAGLSYVKEQFQESAQNQNLVGSTFAERYNRTLPHGILFTEQLAATPAWNNTNAYSAAGGAGLTLPVYKRLSLAVSTLDTFLNNPPPGFKKNSFQFTTGLTYTLP